MRLHRIIAEIDAKLRCTPCLCGEIGTWHKECYAGKTDAQIQKRYAEIYKQIYKRLGPYTKK